MKKKKFKLELTGFIAVTEGHFLFSFLTPTIYDTKEDAVKRIEDYRISTRQLENKEIVFDVYEGKKNEKLVDTITWADKKKYSLQKNYKPYTENSLHSFRELFEKYLNKEMYSIDDVHNLNLEVVAYGTKGTFVTE